MASVLSPPAPARLTRKAESPAPLVRKAERRSVPMARPDPRGEWQQVLPVRRGAAALEAAREGVMEGEERARGKAVAGLSDDDQGADPDAPALPEEVPMHASDVFFMGAFWPCMA